MNCVLLGCLVVIFHEIYPKEWQRTIVFFLYVICRLFFDHEVGDMFQSVKVLFSPRDIPSCKIVK